jgi:hypothetical protein
VAGALPLDGSVMAIMIDGDAVLLIIMNNITGDLLFGGLVFSFSFLSLFPPSFPLPPFSRSHGS